MAGFAGSSATGWAARASSATASAGTATSGSATAAGGSGTSTGASGADFGRSLEPEFGHRRALGRLIDIRSVLRLGRKRGLDLVEFLVILVRLGAGLVERLRGVQFRRGTGIAGPASPTPTLAPPALQALLALLADRRPRLLRSRRGLHGLALPARLLGGHLLGRLLRGLDAVRMRGLDPLAFPLPVPLLGDLEPRRRRHQAEVDQHQHPHGVGMLEPAQRLTLLVQQIERHLGRRGQRQGGGLAADAVLLNGPQGL